MVLKSEPVANDSPAQPLRAALKRQAYDDLKRLILAGELPGGSVQSVRQLAARLQMSKTPVHAAIERLEAEGLVTLAPQQGVVIRELSVHDIVNHYEIRQAIEPFVMRRLAGRLTETQIEQLRQPRGPARVYQPARRSAADAGGRRVPSTALRIRATTMKSPV